VPPKSRGLTANIGKDQTYEKKNRKLDPAFRNLIDVGYGRLLGVEAA
jgi:hypothetical protein